MASLALVSLETGANELSGVGRDRLVSLLSQARLYCLLLYIVTTGDQRARPESERGRERESETIGSHKTTTK